MQKECFRCNIVKPITEFYRHSEMADGYLGKCKACTKADTRKRYSNNRIEIAAKARRRQRTKRARAKEADRQRRRRASEPEKYRAWRAVRYAVLAGKLKKTPCVFCGNPKVEGHHEDYTKPLCVVWVCFKCHNEKFHGKTCNINNKSDPLPGGLT